MKKSLLLLLFAVLGMFSASAQTGTGVLFLTPASYTFTPTTVDSTTVFDFQVVNTVGVAQTLYFDLPATPFSLSDEGPIEIAANDTIDLSLSFTPGSIGTFTGTLGMVGNIFGSTELVLMGEGIQVVLEWTPSELTFETTAIGQQSSATLFISSNGNGAGVINDIVFSNDFFSLDEYNSTLTINEGTTETLTFLFTPTGAGVFNETVELFTNDPNNSIITIPLNATGISEVSGEVCDVTWSAADSPFTIVGDVTVPEGCNLTIEPGVVVYGQGYRMTVNGALLSAGSSLANIEFHDTRLYADGASLEMSRAEFFGGVEIPTDSILDPLPATTAYQTSFLDVYHDDFESYQIGVNGLFSCDNTESGSDYDMNNTGSQNGCYDLYVESNSTYCHSGSQSFRWRSYEYDANIFYDPIITVPESGDYYLSFGHKVGIRERNCTFYAYYRVNGGGWQEFYDAPRGDYENYGETSSQLDQVIGVQLALNEGDELEMYFRHYIGSTSSCYDNQISYIDDIRLTQLQTAPDVIYTTNGNWDYNTEFAGDGWYLDCASCYSNDVYGGGSEYVEFRTRGCSTCGNDEWLQSPEFVVNESGLLQFEWQEYIPSTYYYWRPRVQVSINGGSYEDVYLWDLSYCESYIYDDYSSWNPRFATLGNVSEGDTFRIRLNPFQNQGNSWDFYIRYKDLDIYTVPISVEENYEYTAFETTGDLNLSACNFTSSLSNLNLNGNDLNIDYSTSPTILENCVIDDLNVIAIDSLVIDNSTISTIWFQNAEMTQEIADVVIQESTIGNADIDWGEFITVQNSHIDNFEPSNLAGNLSTVTIDSSTFGKIDASGWFDMDITHSEVANSLGNGVSITGSSDGHLSMAYCSVTNATGIGVNAPLSVGLIELNNCIIAENGSAGITSGPGTINYCTIVNNGAGWSNSGGNTTNRFITNSIISVSSSVSSASTDYNYTGAFPQFQEGSYLLEPYSPCVDAAMPWNTDQNMPFGIGGLRADMGAYGGPNNAGWGGSPAPDGAATLQAASDSPQDQGYVVGLTFDASAFDNSIISDNISHYAVWRHYDPTGESIASLDEGNWELLGTMPAQGFTGYAYQAEALGNTNVFGTFNSCYTVVAHTDNEDVYWYSNVMCGEAIDNLAPEDPELNGLVLESGGAQISWTPPTEDDYAYTEIFNDDGFTAEVGNDTLVVDVSALAGNTYTYTAVHYDVNGNASDPVSLTLDISAGLDVINLNAGWNLISIDRSLSEGDVEELLSGLQPGNLQYVTGFQNGVQFYDPNGLSFLNTLSELDNGYGYWVKVTEDDVLEVGGASLPLNYRPQLTAGWNLIGYPNEGDSNPADYFADLIVDDNLLYVTGFNEGSQVFDPNGLAFLNTLQALQNGFGYWVKTVVGDEPNGLAPVSTKSNPSYMVLNGTSELNAPGRSVQIINGLREIVATMEILENGYLMTTAVFGADPSETGAPGLQVGDELSFMFDGKLADQTIKWQGGMEYRSLDLTFANATEVLALIPNPAQAITQLSFELLAEASVTIQVSDAAGRLVMDLPLGTLAKGAHQRPLSLTSFEAGVYEVSVVADGVMIGSTRLLKQK